LNRQRRSEHNHGGDDRYESTPEPDRRDLPGVTPECVKEKRGVNNMKVPLQPARPAPFLRNPARNSLNDCLTYACYLHKNNSLYKPCTLSTEYPATFFPHFAVFSNLLRNLQTSSSAAETQANLCNSEQLQARRMTGSPLFFVVNEI